MWMDHINYHKLSPHNPHRVLSQFGDFSWLKIKLNLKNASIHLFFVSFDKILQMCETLFILFFFAVATILWLCEIYFQHWNKMMIRLLNASRKKIQETEIKYELKQKIILVDIFKKIKDRKISEQSFRIAFNVNFILTTFSDSDYFIFV